MENAQPRQWNEDPDETRPLFLVDPIDPITDSDTMGTGGDIAPALSVEDYLKREEGSHLRHEYVRGRTFAMGGGSREHNRIALNLAAALNVHLRGRPCEAFMADMKVRIEGASDDVFYYPDIVVACDPSDRDRFFITKPSVIVEVLSPGTERIDRGEKFFAYRQLPSLDSYVLIAQSVPRVEIYRRSADWKPTVVTAADGPEAKLELPLLQFVLSFADLYAGVTRRT